MNQEEHERFTLERLGLSDMVIGWLICAMVIVVVVALVCATICKCNHVSLFF